MQDLQIPPVTPDHVSQDSLSKHSPWENGSRSIQLASLGIADDPKVIDTLSLSLALRLPKPHGTSELGLNSTEQPSPSEAHNKEEMAASTKSHEALLARNASLSEPQNPLAGELELMPQIGVGEGFLNLSSKLKEEPRPTGGDHKQAGTKAGDEGKSLSDQRLKKEEPIQSHGAEQKLESSKQGTHKESDGTEIVSAKSESADGAGSESSSISVGLEATVVPKEDASMGIESREQKAEDGQHQQHNKDFDDANGAAMNLENDQGRKVFAPGESEEHISLQKLKDQQRNRDVAVVKGAAINTKCEKERSQRAPQETDKDVLLENVNRPATDTRNTRETVNKAPKDSDEDVPLSCLRRPPVKDLQKSRPAKTEHEEEKPALLSAAAPDRKQQAVLGTKDSAQNGQVESLTYSMASTIEKVNLGTTSEEGSPTAEKENRDAGSRQPFGSSLAQEGPVPKESGLNGSKGSGERKALVQCDECGKMRILVKEGLTMREEINGQDWWTCEMGGLLCEAPEDPEVDSFNTLKAEKKLAAANGKKMEHKSANGVPKVKLKLKASPAKLKQKVGGTGLADNKGKSAEKAGWKLAGGQDTDRGGKDEIAGTETAEKSGGTFFVPEGFMLTFTARHTEKSVALGDL